MTTETNTAEHATERKIRVLIVDDSQTIRSISGVLAGLGFEVETAEDGFGALAALSYFHADIIFIDVQMPRLDGYETISLIRVNPALAAVPVVMMSSRDGAFDVAKGKLIGCTDYIIKPFEQSDIVRVIKQYVGTDVTGAASVATKAAGV